MTDASAALPDRERAELADLLDKLGPDAPTRCAGWSTAHLAAHLVVRDGRPDALLGFGVEMMGGGGPAVGWAHRLEDRLRTSMPYPRIVDRLRSGPPLWSPFAWPGLSRVFNAAELTIHHEDVRRAQPEWAPRPLSRADQDELWRSALFFARMAGRRAGGLTLRRTDVPDGEQRLGDGGRTVAGEPLELLLWTSGRRDVARVEVT